MSSSRNDSCPDSSTAPDTSYSSAGSIRPPIAPTTWASGLRSRTRHFDALHRGVAVGLGDLVELVDHDQRCRAVAGGCGAAAVDGVEVRGGVDDVDDAARPDPLDPAEADDPGQGDGVGEAAGLDDDGVQRQPRVGELLQRVVQPALVGQAADAAAGDRRRLVDLPGHQCGIDVESRRSR